MLEFRDGRTAGVVVPASIIHGRREQDLAVCGTAIRMEYWIDDRTAQAKQMPTSVGCA